MRVQNIARLSPPCGAASGSSIQRAHGVRIALVDVGERAARPGAEVALGDRLVDLRLEPGRLGRLAAAPRRDS